jgi:hypothetical protein
LGTIPDWGRFVFHLEEGRQIVRLTLS